MLKSAAYKTWYNEWKWDLCTEKGWATLARKNRHDNVEIDDWNKEDWEDQEWINKNTGRCGKHKWGHTHKRTEPETVRLRWKKDCIIYTIILLKSVGVGKLQVAIIVPSSREMSQTVRINRKHILSRVRVSIRPSNFCVREKHPKLSRIPSRPRQCRNLPLFAGHGRSIASDNVGDYMSGDNSDHRA